MPATIANDSLSGKPWAPATGEGVLMIYGYGADLGNFGVFAEHLKSSLIGKYGKNIHLEYIDDKFQFLEFFNKMNLGFKVRELHIFSHAFGGGLALGYHLHADDQLRQQLWEQSVRRGFRVTYDEVVKTEKGLLLLGDLHRQEKDPVRMRALREKFTPGAMIKIWGCMSGLVHRFSDDPGTYYWEALNTPYIGPEGPKNSKPFAQHLANFFGVKAYGALSGSHVEVWYEGAWIKSDQYKMKVGTYPSPKLKHRMHPDVGDYAVFLPQP
jgi:hypothetical protein